jgi:hypothetical protein
MGRENIKNRKGYQKNIKKPKAGSKKLRLRYKKYELVRISVSYGLYFKRSTNLTLLYQSDINAVICSQRVSLPL